MDARPNRRYKAAFSNSSCLKSVFDKLYFRDGLVWMEEEKPPASPVQPSNRKLTFGALLTRERFLCFSKRTLHVIK